MRLRRGPVSFLATFVLVAGFLSVTPLPVLVTQPAFADPAPSGDEASVPAQPLGTPVLPQPEDAGGPLAAPVFPAASDKAVGLSAVKAGSLVAATPSGSVVSVGPAGTGAMGPAQTAALRGPTKLGGPDGLPVAPSTAPSSVDVRVLDRTQAAAVGGQGLGVVVNRTDKSSAGGAVRLSVDASRFASAYGADYFGRLAMVELPACALTTPTV